MVILYNLRVGTVLSTSRVCPAQAGYRTHTVHVCTKISSAMSKPELEAELTGFLQAGILAEHQAWKHHTMITAVNRILSYIRGSDNLEQTWTKIADEVIDKTNILELAEELHNRSIAKDRAAVQSTLLV